MSLLRPGVIKQHKAKPALHISILFVVLADILPALPHTLWPDIAACMKLFTH